MYRFAPDPAGGCTPDTLRCVVEHKRQGVALSGTDCRNAVADRRRRPAAGGLNRSISRGEDVAVPLRQQGRSATRLGTRALLDKQELSTSVVDAGIAEVDDDLQRKDEVAVEVSVEGIPAKGDSPAEAWQ